MSAPAVAMSVSLPLALQIPGQGLSCDAGYCFFKGVPDPVSLPSQNSLGYWFSSYVCQYLLTFVDVDLLLVGAVSKCRPKSSNDEMGNFYLTLLIS